MNQNEIVKVMETLASAKVGDYSVLANVKPTDLSSLYLATKPKDGYFGNADGGKLWTTAVARSFTFHWNNAVERGLTKAEFYAETGQKVTENDQGQVTCKSIERIANAIRSPYSQAAKKAEVAIKKLRESIATGKVPEEKGQAEISKLAASEQRYRDHRPLRSFPRGRSGGSDPFKTADALIAMLG